MNGAWVQFAKTGSPNGNGLPRWPALTPKNLQYLEYGDEIQVRRELRNQQMTFFSECFGRVRAAKATASH
jgi:para-nitrobenzyl esterase